MDDTANGGDPATELPSDCWHHVLEYLDGRALGRAASVNRSWRVGACDDRLWSARFKLDWSPEYSGFLRTNDTGKDTRSLYMRWQTGRPAGVRVIPGESNYQDVSGLQLSLSEGLVAWSTGSNGLLICTDLTTGQKRTSVWHGHKGHCCIAILESKGLVCTGGGKNIIGWDPRQKAGGLSLSPAFTLDCTQSGPGTHRIFTITPAGPPEGDGANQVLTGGIGDAVYCWDVRYINSGPVRKFEGPSNTSVYCLARDTHYGTLLAGGTDGITCWDYETGRLLPKLVTSGCPPHNHRNDLQNEPAGIGSIVAGKDRVVAKGSWSRVFEWDAPDPKAFVEDRSPGAIVGVPFTKQWVDCIKGLGEGPTGILAGMSNGTVSFIKDLNEPSPVVWTLEDSLPLEQRPTSSHSVFSMAALDHLIVTGYYGGTLRVTCMDTPWETGGSIR